MLGGRDHVVDVRAYQGGVASREPWGSFLYSILLCSVLFDSFVVRRQRGHNMQLQEEGAQTIARRLLVAGRFELAHSSSYTTRVPCKTDTPKNSSSFG